MASSKRRSFWGWGYEGEGPNPAQRDGIARTLAERFGGSARAAQPPPRLEDITLSDSTVAVPPALAHLCSDDRYERASHTYGKSYRDVVRAYRGDFSPAPAVVARPKTEADVVALLEWCSEAGLPAVPYGGGSSVVGGVECRGAVSIDLTGLDRVMEIDPVSRAARIQAGALGPVLEDQLRPHGYTLRHFPQSFEFSTLGGWLATRSGGHYATVYTHIDDLCESLRVVTPSGICESRRLPGSGAGPSPDRMFLGSEGTLGVITEAWMRVQDRPRWKATASVHFPSFEAGASATRAVAQSGLFPTNCRLLDPVEAMTSAGVTDGASILVLGFESADHPVDAWLDRAVSCCQDHGGSIPEGIRRTAPSGDEEPTAAASADTWRNSFLRAPYTRDALIAMSVIAETFETACPWDAFPALHAEVMATVTKALDEVCGGGWVTCRFTHVYPDGPAPYFTVLAPGRPGSELEMWAEVKAAASEVLLANGGTITHHHAVGRDHRPWYDRQRPAVFARALEAAKTALDPSGIMNPGVLIG